jgi:preprotein translocase subunit SecF
MITVLAIIFFTSGSLKDFGLALFVGMISGAYSTIFIASAFVLWWENRAEKRRAQKLAPPATSRAATPKAAKLQKKQA